MRYDYSLQVIINQSILLRQIYHCIHAEQFYSMIYIFENNHRYTVFLLEKNTVFDSQACDCPLESILEDSRCSLKTSLATI